MGEVNLMINGRSYGVSCDDGQEQRVLDLGRYVDLRMKEISRAGAAANESHLMVLTALMMADEISDLRDNVGHLNHKSAQTDILMQEEAVIAQAIDDLADRIDLIATRIQKA